MGRGHQTDSYSSQACIQHDLLLWYDSVQNSKRRLSPLAINPAFFRYLSASSRLATNTAGAVAESLVITTDRCPSIEVKSRLEAMKKSIAAASIVKMFSCL